MILNGISLSGCKDYTDKQTKKAASPKDYYHNAKSANADDVKEGHEIKELTRDISEDKGNLREETGTVTQVLVKPDGSRVLLLRYWQQGWRLL